MSARVMKTNPPVSATLGTPLDGLDGALRVNGRDPAQAHRAMIRALNQRRQDEERLHAALLYTGVERAMRMWG